VSEGHSEIIRRSYQAFCDDDPETLLTLYCSDAVWDFTHWEVWPDATAYRGSDITNVLRLLRDAFGEIDHQPVEIVEVGANRVFVKAEGTFRGKASGATVDVPPYAQIIEFRDDLIARVENYSDVDAARRAAGIGKR
jgi:ketosteroid isomerase-like protein